MLFYYWSRSFFVLSVIMAFQAMGSFTPVPNKQASATALTRKLDKIKDSFPPQAQVSITVIDTKSGDNIYNFNSGINSIPASTQKLFTTWVAYELLTPQWQCTTSLVYSGEINDGVLNGDLIIKGQGDPAFGSRFFGTDHNHLTIFSHWYKQLQLTGIKQVAGCVYGDAGYLNNRNPGPHALWEDIGNYYAGFSSGLCYRDNRYRLFLKGHQEEGQPVSFIETDPVFTGITTFLSYLKTGPQGSGDRAYIFGSPLSRVRIIEGTYPAGNEKFFIQGSLPHSDWTCAKEFKFFLESKKLPFGTEVLPCKTHENYSEYLLHMKKSRRMKTTPIVYHVSPPLVSIITHINKKSDNNYAEQLLCLLGKADGGKGSRQEGISLLTDYLQEHGIPKHHFNFKDGSGLSRYNWISGRAVVTLLRLASRHPQFAGFQKTLLCPSSVQKKWRGLGQGWEKKLWVKTGTMEGVFALAGYLKTDSERLFCFSININNSFFHSSDLYPIVCSFLLALKKDFIHK